MNRRKSKKADNKPGCFVNTKPIRKAPARCRFGACPRAGRGNRIVYYYGMLNGVSIYTEKPKRYGAHAVTIGSPWCLQRAAMLAAATVGCKPCEIQGILSANGTVVSDSKSRDEHDAAVLRIMESIAYWHRML